MVELLKRERIGCVWIHEMEIEETQRIPGHRLLDGICV